MRKTIAITAIIGAALLGLGTGVSQAATVPPGSHRGIVVERNPNDRITGYTLQNADPVTGRGGLLPVGDGAIYAVHWTIESHHKVKGTGRYVWGRMGSYVSGPVALVLMGSSNYRYTSIDITLTQSWYGYTNGPYPPYGHGAHHTFAHTIVAVNDPTTNLERFSAPGYPS